MFPRKEPAESHQYRKANRKALLVSGAAVGQVAGHEAKKKGNRNFQCQVSAQLNMSNQCSKEMTAHVKLTPAAFYVKQQKTQEWRSASKHHRSEGSSEERVKHSTSYSYDLVYINIA